MSAVPGPVYGLEIPPGEILIPAGTDFPASFRITMAAVDPTQEPEADESGNIPSVPRSTLRIVKRTFPGLDDEEDEELDEEALRALIGENSDDEDSDDEPNGGPSDPAKSKKQKQSAAIKALLAATNSDDDDEEMDDAKPNGVSKSSKAKGKAPASDDDEDEDEDEDDDSEDGGDMEDFVVCTLDTERHYQQPLDITVSHSEQVFFVVSGTHSIHLTGNYIMADEDEDDEDDEDEYDLSPDELDFTMGEDMDEDESDELDDVDNPRVTEVDSEEEAPKLVEAKKGKNKRAAAEAESLDEIMAADEAKLSKKDKKKLKNNKGEAVAAAAEEAKKDKKVQFAKNLEQGPTGSTAEKAKATKATVGVKNVNGVTVDDRTIGSGRTVKNGDSVGVRYIGKLSNGKQFDANKKGKPFTFKVGKGEVIKGWDVGVVGMAIGGERRLTIPAHLGYGSRGMPGIPANSQLTFDVKLLEIK